MFHILSAILLGVILVIVFYMAKGAVDIVREARRQVRARREVNDQDSHMDVG